MSERVWVWVGHMGLGERIQYVLENFGDRLTDVSIFGWSVMRSGELVETFDPRQLDPYRAKWPHIRWWQCFRNMDGPDAAQYGPRVIFDALRDSASARNRLANEVQANFEQFPWLYGVDIDLESGGNERQAESEEIFRVVANRARSLGKRCGAALPPLTATGSVGGENWVRYRQLGEILDNVEIMSYDFAWAGSAPGPISPGFWMNDVYNWVSSQVDSRKVYMGVPLYAYYWRLHDYPPNLGNPWRGLSGTYYSFWQQFTGYVTWYDEQTQPRAGWLAYRDRESRAMWGFLHAYDWLESSMFEERYRVQYDDFQGKGYAVRYGLPSGSPQWAIADNSAGDSRAVYEMLPAPITDVYGNENGPYRGFTFTLEMLKREPVAATIIDDFATSEQQLGTVYRLPDGSNSWSHWESGAYRQYRGSGRLEYNNSFGSQPLYVQGRAQFATSGTFSVYSQGWRAELHNSGTLRLYRGDTLRETTYVAARGVGLAPQAGQAVLGLRVRENSARVYFSVSEEGRIANPIEVKGSSPPGGPTGFNASATIWMDHAYLGDGWWYQPREAVEVTIDGTSRVMGRYERENITWDRSINAFKPDDDVNEWETRADQWTEYSIMDWGYEHWVNAPFEFGTQSDVRVVPTDHDVWWGRMVIFDRDGGFIAYCNDAQAVAYWRSRAENDWKLAGIAAWSLGQEDVRLWDYLGGGELAHEDTWLDGV